MPVDTLISIEKKTLGIFCLGIFLQHIVLVVLNFKSNDFLWTTHDFIVLN